MPASAKRNEQASFKDFAMIARLMFAMVNFAARKGLNESRETDSREITWKQQARRTGIRGETYAYWYLRRQGYTMVARNYVSTGLKGEIDLIGYDGAVLAFVEVKTRKAGDGNRPTPEEAVTGEKQGHLTRIARQFLRARHIEGGSWRFDVLAIEGIAGRRPQVRLHKGAFVPRAGWHA
jgi:putative endonuclease